MSCVANLIICDTFLVIGTRLSILWGGGGGQNLSFPLTSPDAVNTAGACATVVNKCQKNDSTKYCQSLYIFYQKMCVFEWIEQLKKSHFVKKWITFNPDLNNITRQAGMHLSLLWQHCINTKISRICTTADNDEIKHAVWNIWLTIYCHDVMVKWNDLTLWLF